MPKTGFNLGLNSYGRVAGGQEGSGQAQIVQPYDASKFAKLELAQKEKDREEKAKGMKDARAFKPEEFEKINEYWVEDAKFYAKETQAVTKDMTNNTVQYYNNLATIKDPDALFDANLKVAEDRSKINAKVKQLNEEVTLGMQNKDFYEKSQALYDSKQGDWDADETEARRNEFLNIETRPDLIEQAGGNKQAARRLLVEEYGGSLVVEKWDQAKHRTNNIAANEARATTKQSGWSDADVASGMIYHSTSSNTYHDLRKAKEDDMNIIQGSRQYQKYIKSDDKLGEDLAAYYPNKSLGEITEREIIDWAKQSPVYEEFVKDNYMPGDITKYDRTMSEMSSGGAGSSVIPADAPLVVTDLQTEFTKLPYFKEVPFGKWTGQQQSNWRVAGVSGQQLKKADQRSTTATIAYGKSTKIYSALTGEDITDQVDVGAFEEKGQGTVVNTFFATKPFTYTDSLGKKQYVREGQEIPKDAIEGKAPLVDYTTKRKYYTTAEGQTDKNLQIIVVQDISGYTNGTDKTKDDQWINDKNVRLGYYNQATVDGQPAGNWIQNKAIEYGGDTPENWEKAEQDAISKISSGQTGGTGTTGGTSR